MSVDKISRKLSTFLAYVQLMTSLEPGEGNIANPRIKAVLMESWEFYKGTNETELQKKGAQIISALEPLVLRYNTFAPPKMSIDSIAQDFNTLCSINKNLYSTGIEYRWLDERMDCSKMGFPNDLPWHATIGIGHHAGLASIEEEFLLRDAFFMLESAEVSFSAMHGGAETFKHQGKGNDSDTTKVLGLANHNVAAYSRLCMVSFFSFIEAFVNSIGYDFSRRDQNLLPADQIEILNGNKKGKLISIEYKIEKFPSIIRNDKRTPIIISDPCQLREPFTSFIQRIKSIRDSSVHYSPLKEAIWRTPQNWLENARSTAKLCTQVASEFWKACFPSRSQPVYLNLLDYDKHITMAKERLRAINDLESSIKIHGTN